MRFGQDAERRNSQNSASRKNTSNTATKVTRPTTPGGLRFSNEAESPAGVRFSTEAASTLESRGVPPDNSIYAESQSQDVSQSPSGLRLSQAHRTPLKSSLKRKSTVDLTEVAVKKTKVAQASHMTPSNRPVRAQSIGIPSAQSSPQPTPGTAARKSVGALSHLRTSEGHPKPKTGPAKTYSTKPTSTTTTKSSSTKPTRTASGSQ